MPNHGGQRRTVEYSCGFILKGHPTEVNKKHERHLRFCSHCAENMPGKLEGFSKPNGSINGWNGISENGSISNTRALSVVKDGSVTDVLTNAKREIDARKIDILSSVILGDEPSNKEGIISTITEIREILRDTENYQHIQRFDKYTEEKMVAMTVTQLEIINSLFMETLVKNRIRVV